MKKIFSLISLFILASCQPETSLEWAAPNYIVEKEIREDYNYGLKMADREYVVSVLVDVFNVSDATLRTSINNQILLRPEFGGACDPYSESDLGTSKIEFSNERCINGISGVLVSTNNPMRYAITAKVCEELLGNSQILKNIKQKMGVTDKDSVITGAHVTKAWSLFYPQEKISTSVLEGLMGVVKASSSSDEGVKNTMLTLCISPQWQTF